MKNKLLLLTVCFIFSSATLLADVVVGKGGKVGYVNEAGELIVPYQYNELQFLPDLQLFWCKKGNRYGLLDAQGNVLLKPENIYISELSPAGWAVVVGKTKQEIGVINSKGKFVCPISKNGSFVDIDGSIKSLTSFVDSIGEVLAFAVGDTYYDLEGNEKGTFLFKSEPNTGGYRSVVGSSDKWGIVNRAFDFTVPYTYTYMGKYKQSFVVPEDNICIFAYEDQKYGTVDVSTNEVILPFMYPALFRCENRLTIFKDPDSGLFGMFRDKEQVCPAIYEDVYTRVNPHSFAGKKNNKWQLYAYDSKETTLFYSVCIPYKEEVDSCHGEMLYMMGQVSDNDTTFTIFNAFLQKVTPIQASSSEEAVQLCDYFAHTPIVEMSDIDLRRLRLFLSKRTRKYTLSSIVPDADWDY